MRSDFQALHLQTNNSYSRVDIVQMQPLVMIYDATAACTHTIPQLPNPSVLIPLLHPLFASFESSTHHPPIVPGTSSPHVFPCSNICFLGPPVHLLHTCLPVHLCACQAQQSRTCSFHPASSSPQASATPASSSALLPHSALAPHFSTLSSTFACWSPHS